jgi:hypothetical protein
MNDKVFQRFVNLTCIYSPCYEKGVVNSGQRMYEKKLSLLFDIFPTTESIPLQKCEKEGL